MNNRLGKIWLLLNKRQSRDDYCDLFKEAMACIMANDDDGLDKIIAELEKSQFQQAKDKMSKLWKPSPNVQQAGKELDAYTNFLTQWQKSTNANNDKIFGYPIHNVGMTKDEIVARCSSIHTELMQSTHGIDQSKLLALVMQGVILEDVSFFDKADEMVKLRNYDYIHPCLECKKEFEQEKEGLIYELARVVKDRAQLARKDVAWAKERKALIKNIEAMKKESVQHWIRRATMRMHERN